MFFWLWFYLAPPTKATKAHYWDDWEASNEEIREVAEKFVIANVPMCQVSKEEKAYEFVEKVPKI